MSDELRKEQHDRINQRIKDEYKRLVSALVSKGHMVDGNERYPLAEIDGVRVDVGLDAERYGGSWSRGYTGKLRLRVGSRSYPEPKAGFDMDKCVERIIERKDRIAETQRHREAVAKAEEEAGEYFEAACERLSKVDGGITTRDARYGKIWAYVSGASCEIKVAGKDKITFSVTATVEQVERMIRALKE